MIKISDVSSTLDENNLENINIIGNVENINILPNVLSGSYQSKIPETSYKLLTPPLVGVVNSEVKIPEYIIVNDGASNNLSTPNYKVRYKDYIKNVASWELYPTWPEETIRANIYAIISFTLNRIYTNWYRDKGKNFDITNSTAYDLAFNYGRTIYSNIDSIVDEMFSTYIKDKNRKQPLLAQFCNGEYSSCPDWLNKWDSKRLGDDGKSAIEILRSFYGDNIELDKVNNIKWIKRKYPGHDLVFGSSSDDIKFMEEYLNEIGKVYPTITAYTPDGIYGNLTQQAVLEFQKIFGLKQTGIIDYATWYDIVEAYNAIKNISD